MRTARGSQGAGPIEAAFLGGMGRDETHAPARVERGPAGGFKKGGGEEGRTQKSQWAGGGAG